jgi:hypothetical protein
LAASCWNNATEQRTCGTRGGGVVRACGDCAGQCRFVKSWCIRRGAAQFCRGGGSWPFLELCSGSTDRASSARAGSVRTRGSWSVDGARYKCREVGGRKKQMGHGGMLGMLVPHSGRGLAGWAGWTSRPGSTGRVLVARDPWLVLATKMCVQDLARRPA